MPRPRLQIDFETWCVLDLLAVGDYVYAEKSVPVLTGLKYNDEATQVFDHSSNFNAGMDDFGSFDLSCAPSCPDILAEAIEDGWWIVAHNYLFEYNHLVQAKRFGWPTPRLDRMICTAAKSRYYGVPNSLEKSAQFLNVPTLKRETGKALMKKFSGPVKLSTKRGAPVGVKAIDADSADWREYKLYNRDDVEAQYGIDCALPDIPEKYAAGFYMDGRMNMRGFEVDLHGVQNGVKFYTYFHTALENRFKELSGGVAPSQVAKVREALASDGLDTDNLQSATIRDTLLDDDAMGRTLLTDNVREMLEIRAETAKASVKKLWAFLARTASDMRVHGGFLWYGAHTGRWSSRGVQLQNFPRGLKGAMAFLGALYALLAGAVGRAELVTAGLFYPNPLGVLSSALRGFVRAAKGKRFLVVDYAQIELRVAAWIAGELELLESLRSGVDPYKKFASEHMFGIAIELITSYMRQIAKSALLGAQYQIWIPAFIEYCVNVAGFRPTLEEATNAILSYRSANPNIVDIWKSIEKVCVFAVENKTTATVNNLRFKYETVNGRNWLRIYLPSGRPISYPEPRVTERITEHERTYPDGSPILDDKGQPTFYTKRKWVLSFATEWKGRITREYTYGGKLFENIVQGTSADIMTTGMIVAEDAGYMPVMTVHDENVTEVDKDFGSVEELCELVCQLPKEYDGLPIKAEGFECVRYRKG